MGNTLAEKKELVMRYLPLGMSLQDCMYYAEMTEDEMDECENDPRFKQKTDLILLEEQHALLDLFNSALKSNAREGKTGEVLYKLGLLNPSRFGTPAQRANAGGAGDGLTLNIHIDNNKSSLKQDNVEVFEAQQELDGKAAQLDVTVED